MELGIILKKRDEYTLNAALIMDLKPSIGIVYAPSKNSIVSPAFSVTRAFFQLDLYP